MSHDSQLQQAVLAEFAWEPSVDGAHIGVAAQDGVVTLTGHVETYAQKHAAEAAAGRVRGVTAVAEEIQVRLPFGARRDDDQIAAAAANGLAWDTSVPRDAVKVKVENGWITLNGQVDCGYQTESAELDVRRLLGVTGVTNQITIKPKVDVANLSDDITHALHRSWLFDPKLITVRAEGGKVWLTGSVPTPHDRQVAAATAWAGSGVEAVQNDITII